MMLVPLTLGLIGFALSLLSLALLGGLVGWGVLVRRWSFVVDGQTIDVKNYPSREEVLVDGTLRPDTSVAGEGLTGCATHTVVLDSGRIVTVSITAEGLGVRCTAHVDGALVFDSDPGSAPEVPSIDPEPRDDRWAAAVVLLDELSKTPDLANSAARLRTQLRASLLSLASARTSGEAHRALGSTDDEVEVVVRQREAEVQRTLTLLRQLHLEAQSRETEPVDVDVVHESIRRLEAEREVAELQVRARAVSTSQRQG